MIMKKLIFVLIMLPFLVSAEPTNVTVTGATWNPVTADTAGGQTTIDGYRFYCGALSKVYRVPVETINTKINLDDVALDGVNYCAVSAYQGAEESDYSNEIVFFSNNGQHVKITLAAPGFLKLNK